MSRLFKFLHFTAEFLVRSCLAVLSFCLRNAIKGDDADDDSDGDDKPMCKQHGIRNGPFKCT